MTMEERDLMIEDRGLERGRKEGREEGRKEGREEGRKITLIAQICRKIKKKNRRNLLPRNWKKTFR